MLLSMPIALCGLNPGTKVSAEGPKPSSKRQVTALAYTELVRPESLRLRKNSLLAGLCNKLLLGLASTAGKKVLYHSTQKANHSRPGANLYTYAQ